MDQRYNRWQKIILISRCVFVLLIIVPSFGFLSGKKNGQRHENTVVSQAKKYFRVIAYLDLFTFS